MSRENRSRSWTTKCLNYLFSISFSLFISCVLPSSPFPHCTKKPHRDPQFFFYLHFFLSPSPHSSSSWVPVYCDSTQMLAVMSIGFLLQNREDAVVWRGPKKNGECSTCCGFTYCKHTHHLVLSGYALGFSSSLPPFSPSIPPPPFLTLPPFLFTPLFPFLPSSLSSPPILPPPSYDQTVSDRCGMGDT